MINNDILRRVSGIFDFNDEKIQAVFALNQGDINAEQLADIFKEKNDPAYRELLDVELASFLNGLIIDKRGKKEGPQHQAEQVLNNNLIFNKVKIALALKADEVISILELAGLSLSKYELSALFRNVNHKHYRECTDDVLSTFLKGLKVKFQG
ncbi:hypothetical protein A9Q74_00190 [Colwellia sp. 39_35_sub15_T18]|nr:hypothetical protein A9Q74_00190 [Colwellia sp. 39_35_sub15_T18]